MPTLRIMSIYKERKRTFAAELAQARAEREQFKTTLAVRFGKEASEPRKLPEEGSIAAKKLQTLDRKVMAVRKKIRTPDCWFRESPGPISVLDLVGLSWRMVNEKCSADGQLPISGVLWLLNVLRTTDQVMPTEEHAREWVARGLGPWHLSEKWRQLLRRRRLRLALLLHTAVMLEEDVRWRFRL